MGGDRGLVSGDQYLGALFVFVYEAIRKHLLLIIAAAFVVAAIAYFVTPRPSPIFEVQTSIKNGRTAGVDLMNLQNTVARINSSSFRRHLLQLLNLSVADRAGQLISNSLTAKAETSDLLSVSLRSTNEEQGRRALDLVVKALNDKQEEITKPMLSDIKGQVAEIDANVASLSEIQRTLKQALSSMAKAPTAGGASDTQAPDLRGVWLLDAFSRNEKALIDAREERRNLATRLEKANTYPTAIVDDVVVSPIPTSPRPSRIALLAGLFTFLGAVVFMVLSRRREIRV